MRHWLALLFCTLATTTAASPIDPNTLSIAHQTFTLENGLRVVVHEDRSVPLVAVNLWYHVGSRNERRGRTGFAHLFEHFFFNGSENHPHGFREAMDDLGANNRNGTTSVDRTNFFEDVPTSALERTLYLEADRMGFLAGNLSPEMLERERGVVKNEKRQGDNQPYGRVFPRIFEAMYPYSHPYSWTPIGSMDDLNAATLSDIKDWYSAWYGPNNAVLALAGDINIDEAKTLVDKYFAGIKPGAPVAKLQTWVPKLDADVRDSMQDQVPHTRIYRAWHAPALGERRLHALELFASTLADSASSPLKKSLVFEQQLATNTNAFVWSGELASMLIVTVDVKAGVNALDAERALQAVIDKQLKSGPTNEHIDLARTRFLASAARGMERLGGFGGRADVLAESLTTLGSADGYLNRLRDLASMHRLEVTNSAQEWLRLRHYTLTVSPFPALRAVSDDLDRRQLPALGAAPSVKFPDMQRATLSNGLQVLLMERHSAPLVNFALAVDAGIAADPSDQRGTGRFAMELLLKGTQSSDNYAIADRRDALGAELSIEHGLDQSLLYLSTLKPNLAESMYLYADIARNPAFAAPMIEVQRKQQLAAIEQQKANPNGMAIRIAAPLLYGATHPYGQAPGGLGDAAVVNRLQREAIASWYGRWFVPSNATLIVAGDVTMAELMPLLERSFASWSGKPAPKKSMGAANSGGRGKIFLIDKPGAPQSLILAAHIVAAGARADDLALETVMRNFGGMATARLNRNLRLDKHWSYGASGGINNARGPRLFNVIAPVQTDRTSDAMLEIHKEIVGIKGERPLTGEELSSILRSQNGRLAGRFETLNSLIGAGLDVVNLERDPTYYTDYTRQLRRLDGPTLNAAAAAVVKPNELMWLVVGDLSRIEEDVRALKLGEVMRIKMQ